MKPQRPEARERCTLLSQRLHDRFISALQFNRIDFRLPWFRHHFPKAKLIHLYRHPRDQWCSSLVDLKAYPHDARREDFAAHDHFYLLNWARDLKYHFPFLAEQSVSHPYQLFYYIWKLSYLFGRKYAHHSVVFEHLVEGPKAQLGELFRVLNLDGVGLDQLLPLFAKPSLGKWKDYAEAWFRYHEEACETVLADFLAQPH